MNRESMLEHLRRQGEEAIAELWRAAEAKIEERRAEAGRSSARRREEAEVEGAARRSQSARDVLMAARRQAEEQRNGCRHQLRQRLAALAPPILLSLRDEEYPRTFALLVAELPEQEWIAATVNPDDRELAAAAFPGAAIAIDPLMSGGFTVTGRGGRMRVVNTFEKRLERAWPELLPPLLGDILGEEKR